MSEELGKKIDVLIEQQERTNYLLEDICAMLEKMQDALGCELDEEEEEPLHPIAG